MANCKQLILACSIINIIHNNYNYIYVELEFEVNALVHVHNYVRTVAA